MGKFYGRRSAESKVRGLLETMRINTLGEGKKKNLKQRAGRYLSFIPKEKRDGYKKGLEK